MPAPREQPCVMRATMSCPGPMSCFAWALVHCMSPQVRCKELPCLGTNACLVCACTPALPSKHQQGNGVKKPQDFWRCPYQVDLARLTCSKSSCGSGMLQILQRFYEGLNVSTLKFFDTTRVLLQNSLSTHSSFDRKTRDSAHQVDPSRGSEGDSGSS